jgi:hypothetical protein
MKLVPENINEYVSHDANRNADIEIDRWQSKKEGKNPLREYIHQVINFIWDMVPDDIARETGLSPEIIDDLITAEEDRIITSTVYDMYNDYVAPEAAAMELGTQISNYIMGQTR